MKRLTWWLMKTGKIDSAEDAIFMMALEKFLYGNFGEITIEDLMILRENLDPESWENVRKMIKDLLDGSDDDDS